MLLIFTTKSKRFLINWLAHLTLTNENQQLQLIIIMQSKAFSSELHFSKPQTQKSTLRTRASRNLSSQRSATRVNSRNLRAKVKSLLPLDICCKYEERNNRLRKIERFKAKEEEQLRIRKRLKPWSNSQESLGKVFLEDFKKVDPIHMFSKLTKDEIQEIRDYKHYFLGDNHIGDFESFLKPKQSEQFKPALKTDRTNRTNRTNVMEERQLTLVSTVKSRQYCSGKNWQSTQLKIKDLQEEDHSLRQTKKLIIELKQRRATNNVSLLHQTLQGRLENRKIHRKMAEDKIKQFKRAQEEDEVIQNITCKLRTMCSFNKKS